MFISPVCDGEVLHIVSSLRKKKSKGHDGIYTVLIKGVINVILQPLIYIFNLSFSTGVFPDQIKIAISKKMSMLLFADDINAFLSGPDCSEEARQINIELDSLSTCLTFDVNIMEIGDTYFFVIFPHIGQNGAQQHFLVTQTPYLGGFKDFVSSDPISAYQVLSFDMIIVEIGDT